MPIGAGNYSALTDMINRTASGVAGVVGGAAEKVLDKWGVSRGGNGVTDNVSSEDDAYAIQDRPELSLMSVKDVMDGISGLDIKGDSSLSDKMVPYFIRLFNAKIDDNELTLSMLGNNAAPGGDSDLIGTQLNTPAYVEGRSYADFGLEMKMNEKGGVMSTSSSTANYSPFYNRGRIYSNVENLYHDDLGIGTFTNKTITGDDPRSILYKTKELFRQRRIKTLISGFGTHADFGSDSTGYNGEVDDPRFGESRGRNLLTLEAERNGGFYNINGYNNPYCRVWTHHYQYSKLADLMRPFDGETTSSFHKWDKFSLDDANEEHQESMNKVAYWGWKYNNEGWKNSVLDQENGLVNIAPKYVNGGGTNIHTKDCMFSIENLAWKDYDPYMFEKSLSWEQRGPMGGRIMWFPPYDISFSENVSAKWNQNDFIGRGEAVYSYANTVRSGTLSFLMVIDHPSVVDYALWGDSSNNGDDDVHDTDLLRFFAGCDDTVVLNAARPTPLTDEYLENIEPVPEYEEKTKNPNNSPAQNVAEEFNFKVYFPNNYTGVWDLRYYDVSPIDYLLHGEGSCFKMNGNKDGVIKTCGENNFGEEDFNLNSGIGYEMGDKGLSYSNKNWFYNDSVTYISTSGGNYKNNMECYYREDGCHHRPGDKTNFTINNRNVPGDTSSSFDRSNNVESYFINLKNTPLSNTWGQILGSGNYKDSKSLQLNRFGDDADEEFLPFFGTGCIFRQSDNFNDELENVKGKSAKKGEKLEKFKELFDGKFEGYNVTVSVAGCASIDGQSDATDPKSNRNYYLAYARAYMVKEWVKKFISGDNVEYESIACDYQKKVQKVPDVNSDTSKKTRYASVKIVLIPKKETQEPTEQATTETIKEIKDYDFVSVGLPKTRAVDRTDTEKVNKVRYDQEYHFFKKLKRENPIVFDRLVDKLKYFDPAFHSMTPEGFNARLTFLHQCTRQGDTTTASDTNASSANNLAFGRPPFCVLRLGDFYRQMIVINSVQIDYSVSDGITWDLNQEGAGVQPLLCRVTLAFNFIGGGDMAGPVRRLQNAMSFNYYANASLYDNRADRPFYKPDYVSGISKFEPDKSYAYSAKMQYDKGKPVRDSKGNITGYQVHDAEYYAKEEGVYVAGVTNAVIPKAEINRTQLKTITDIQDDILDKNFMEDIAEQRRKIAEAMKMHGVLTDTISGNDVVNDENPEEIFKLFDPFAGFVGY